MRASTLLASLTVGTALVATSAADHTSDDEWRVKRVGGDVEVQTELTDGQYRSGKSMVEESLPDGYPAPTPPGAIELKRYPSIRRAEVSGSTSSDRGRNGAFFPLFQHIQSRGIAMTSPVEMDFDEEVGAGDWTMSFLYRSNDLGPLESYDNVRVVDTAPRLVVSVGLSGPYGGTAVERGIAMLETWLDGQKEWSADGDPMALYYNGPYIPDDRKWAEVQIPVRSAAAQVLTTDTDDGADDIIDVATAAGNFNTLAAALQAAGLVETLRGDGPFTVFAPTDEAFAQLPPALVEALLQPENRDRLTAILTYHVVPGALTASDLLGASSSSTVQGETVTASIDGGALRVNDARVVANDVIASNGVIHVVDSVLIPPTVVRALSAPTPASLIELAISRGVPLYNDDQPAACAAVYEVTAQSLLAMSDDDVNALSRERLYEALATIRAQTDPREQAWTLRRALDEVYLALSR